MNIGGIGVLHDEWDGRGLVPGCGEQMHLSCKSCEVVSCVKCPHIKKIRKKTIKKTVVENQWTKHCEEFYFF